MANFVFNVNTNAAIVLTDKLERLNKYAFPNAVRSTLSDGAFHMKKKAIYESANKNMTVRNKTVFKKFTGVEKAKYSRNIEQMKATVGFIDKDGIKGSKVPQGMENNEFGGTDDDGLMYMPKTRISGSQKRLVRKSSRYSKSNLVKGRVRTKKSVSNTMNMLSSYEEKKPTFVTTKKGRFLVQVTEISWNFATSKNTFKLEFLMRDRKRKQARAKATHFNREAAQSTQKLMEGFYAKNAQYHFDKALK
jgi:hypothetical protein